MDTVIEINRKKTFTLADARHLLPIIFRFTEESSREVKAHVNRIEAFSDKTHPAVVKIEEQINDVIERWQSKIEKLGGEPKGLWMADFDNGEGYYCWKYPENEINHWHGYQDGFSGRIVLE
ncbi:DUF2203 domain-containing protein [Bdellovibrio sp. NC01]|nr:DUF2203 domain-containing protein [Bdellovibrio sp. NC01]